MTSFFVKKGKKGKKGKNGVDKEGRKWYNRQALQKREGRADPWKLNNEEEVQRKYEEEANRIREPESNQNSTIPFLEETVKKKKLR